MPKKRLVIIIPTHRPYLTEEDKISLSHLRKYLKKYDTFFVIPKKISAKSFIDLGYRVKKVDNKYFGTLRRANETLLKKDFYTIFNDYNYMLIYQLDALVFSGEVEKWIKKRYDFIAAPWFIPIIGYLTHKKGSPATGGNGGFSLRNIQNFVKVLDLIKKSATRKSASSFQRKLWFLSAFLTGKSRKKWLNAPADNYPFNEDGFWSYEAVKYYPKFKTASFKEALQFGFERYPKKCFELNGKKLPFGAHAWKKYDENFWIPYLLANEPLPAARLRGIPQAGQVLSLASSSRQKREVFAQQNKKVD